MKLTFAEAVQQGLEKNSRIMKQKRKINNLKRRIEEMEAENDWQWEAALEGRTVSDNTRTTAQKNFATLKGEREFNQGLKINPEVSLKEKELWETGLSDESIDFSIELEQPLYPALEAENKKEEQNLQLRLQAERAELQQLKRKLLLDYLADYLELIELKLEEKISSEELELAEKILEMIKEEEKDGYSKRKKVLQAKIDINEAQQDVEEVRNDYQKSLRILKDNLGLENEQQLEVSITKECNLHWLAELEEVLPNLDNSQQLLAQAKANSKELLIQQLERKQLQQEQEELQQEQKPQLDLNANYEGGTDKWQVALNLTHKLFNHKQDELVREELADELAALEAEKTEYIRELQAEIEDLVGEITVNQLQVTEKELRLEESVLDLEESEKEMAADEISALEYQDQQLDLKKAELSLQEEQHQLLLSKYELVKLLGGLKI
ncbi:TolC family protein [Halanaerobacter jeridensis]|uniref:Outer membrane protein TolC n=1 Tax=Halanaerobacter jeridensis TaxID=706427 RepID=A0A939BNN6_9FIRM|nr:TolC family protein [Halanaerobacter jeridensis]MBM7555802.1 outer membrane protein TolC [Halanaerobacter jeridensis]